MCSSSLDATVTSPFQTSAWYPNQCITQKHRPYSQGGCTGFKQTDHSKTLTQQAVMPTS